MERVKRAISLLLCFVMVVGLLPMYAFAATADDALTAALTEAREYIDGITVNNASNDPETVVKNFKTHFTWDNEKREGSKSYLFDWSYYNGVVFEGIEYLYEVTGEEQYKDYVVEYMSSLIASNGTWAKCSNNSSKECAGYNATHGADCYKTASLLLDTYEMTNDSRYLTMAATLYADLDSAAKSYSLSNAGSNYRHTWSSDPTPDLWLDGLYMILPFRAEYAKYIGDQEELDLIVSRMQWVSDNMYDDDSRMFYHAADSASSNSGTFWLRAMGWYAAALADVMDSLEGQNLETVKAQLKKLVDGLLSNTNESVGYMWQNKPSVINLLAENPYETSGTSLVYYAVMKAVNNGWLDESYAHYANTAFAYMVENKLKNGVLTDICFKGAPGSGNETFYDNEGKGLGPFIMLYAEILKYVNREEEPEVTEQTFTVKDADNILTITATATAANAVNASGKVAAVSGLVNEDYLAYEISLENQVADTAMTVAVDLSYGFDEGQLVVYYVDGQGNASEVTGFTASTDAEDFQTITVSDAKVGTYVYGTRYVEIEEDAKLVSIEIVSAPTQTKYFVEAARTETLPLNIAGLVVKATFSDGTVKEIVWNEFVEEADGYSLTFDMSTIGEQEVVVTYTYGDVTCTATFAISIYERSFTSEESHVVIAPAVPGVTSVTVEANTSDETVVSKLTNLVEAFVSYDITLEGYNQGEVVTLTLPVPEGFDTSKLIGISIQDGIVKFIDGTYNAEDNTFTFDVDHFSTQGVGVRAAGDVLEGSTNVVHDPITSGVENGFYLLYNTRAGTTLTGTQDGNTGRLFMNGTADVNNSNLWYISSTNGGYYVRYGGPNGRYLTFARGSSSLSDNPTVITFRYVNNQYWDLGHDGEYLNDWNGPSDSNAGGWSGGAANDEGSRWLLYPVKDVTFAISPKDTTVQAGQTLDLNGTVTVDGKTVELSDCSINWSSSSNSVATVSNGVVTGVADGTTTITATLTQVNGTALQNNIVLHVDVTVQSKTVVSAVLTGNDPVTTKQNVGPDFSKIMLTVTYDDGTTAIITVDNGLIIDGYDISTIGYSYASISYAGEEYGTVRVTVEGNPYAGLENATDYPEYPEDGAVRIDKTATQNATVFKETGVTHVELDVAGISVKPGVDAVLTIDISNSMAWKTGTDDDNFTNNKLTEVMEAINSFADIFLASNKDGSPTNNTISIVFFAGKDTEHWAGGSNTQVDAVLTACSRVSDINIIKSITSQTKFTGKDGNDYEIQIAHVNDSGNVVTYSGQNRGDTNYDYAFWQTEQAVDQIIAANGADSNREIHVIVMTDGCATHFNNVYYNGGSAGNYYRPGTRTTYDNKGNFKNLGSTAWVQWIQQSIEENGGNIYAKRLYEKVDGGYAVGFDMAHGSFSGITSWDPSVHWDMVFNEVVQNTVRDEDGNGMINVTNATDKEILNKFYKSLAEELRYAGSSATATDIIDSDFTLQMAATSGSGDHTATLSDFDIQPSITIKTYDLWTKQETSDTTLIGKRKGSSQDIETVTFNPEGTEAYSNLIDNGNTNIMSTADDGTVTISAHYFTYTKTPEGIETFKWSIGNITDKEIALAFDVYLKGSLEGNSPEGTYYTNESAILEYIDINGKYATQTFPRPAVGWGGASTTIRFYLVNEKGEPVNRDGKVIPMANAIFVGDPVAIGLNLNADATIDAQTIEAAAYVPNEYYLYDINAKYTVQTASGQDNSIIGGISLSEPSEDAFKTAGNKQQTGAQTTIVLSHEETFYTWSYIGFGVRYDLTKEPTDKPLVGDQVVIDYGKAIQIDVLANDPELEGYSRTLSGFVAYNASANLSLKQQNAGATTYTAANGNFSLVNDKVQFQPTKILSEVQKVFYVVKYQHATNVADVFYLWGELYVIPATIVYYETDFADGVFTYSDDWKSPVENGTADGPQDDGTIGQNTYGFDSTYENDAYLSNGSSLYAEGQGLATTYVTFSFTGTGFDLISRTGAAQGSIRVDIYTDADRKNLKKSVTVLNKSESNLELYQIPVVSVNDLDHGTYYVTVGVNAAYTNDTGIPALDALNRGNQFYFDAIRIYDPAKGNAVAETAYSADGEANNVLDEVRQLLISANTFEAIESGSRTPGMVYVDSTYTGDNANHVAGDVNVADYAKVGPNNEVYLSKDQAVAFYVKANSIPASFDVGAKSITGDTAGLKVTIVKNDGTTEAWTVTMPIKSSTVQFIDLLSAQGADASLLYQGAYVVITNTGTGVLSITDIKTAFSVNATAEVDTASVQEANSISVASVMTAQVADPFAVSFTVDGNTLAVAKSVLSPVSAPQEPEVPEEPETPEEPEVDTSVYDILEASLKVNGSRKNRKYTITVVTSQEVEDIEVLQGSQELKPTKITYKDKRKDGTRVWTIVLSRGVSERYNSFTLVGIGEDGIQGEAFELAKSR